ncbi:MAG: DUF1116 domain-containing protein [Chloroflexota bacterium]|nr:DUF1116 domain-containing protein [Chloroflexota bacterium]MDP9472696.1 DUF1116 domain-containing protein [Chloroflexota bacterium]
MTAITELMDSPLRVANLGLPSFADDLRAAGGSVAHVEWAPPLGGDARLAWPLARLLDGDAVGERIRAANAEALDRLLAAEPRWVDVRPAREALAGMGERTILHAGPPIGWTDMAGPMQGAIVGALLFEGIADDADAARRLCERGEVEFAPCHHFDAVGPMAGVISPSMPVLVVENAAGGNRAFSNLNEGLGKALRFGAYGPDVLERLRWMRDVLAPALAVVARRQDGVNLKATTAQALQMGDECHNRNQAASSLLFRQVAPVLARTDLPGAQAADALDFLAENNHFYLNFSMAAAKVTMQAAAGVPHSSLVTVMARNGVEFGIRLSGTGDRWFTGPAQQVRGLFFPGFTEADAALDLGDSAITETSGIGGFAMAAAPAIVQFVGGTPELAMGYTREMFGITLGRNPAYTLPPLGFSGTPTGIDARLVADTGTLPVINTGIAHKAPGVGQVGAGVVHPPLECFAGAIEALAAELGVI